MDFKTAIQGLPDTITERVCITRLAGKGLAIIRARTLRGEFLTGVGTGQRKDTSKSQYSTKPMPVPYGKYLALTEGQAPDKSKVYRSKSGHVMVILTGGYKRYRVLSKKPADHVYMSWTGRMLRNFQIIKDEKGKATLGFQDADSARIARYHNIDGAGKNKVKHPFIGFTTEEENELAGVAETIINDVLKAL